VVGSRARTEGDARPFDDGVYFCGEEKSVSSKPTKLRAICELLWGPRCISELARAMGVAVRTAQHWAVQGDGRMPDYVWPKLRLLLIKRRALIDKMLDDRDLAPRSLRAR